MSITSNIRLSIDIGIDITTIIKININIDIWERPRPVEHHGVAISHGIAAAIGVAADCIPSIHAVPTTHGIAAIHTANAPWIWGVTCGCHGYLLDPCSRATNHVQLECRYMYAISMCVTCMELYRHLFSSVAPNVVPTDTESSRLHVALHVLPTAPTNRRVVGSASGAVSAMDENRRRTRPPTRTVSVQDNVRTHGGSPFGRNSVRWPLQESIAGVRPWSLNLRRSAPPPMPWGPAGKRPGRRPPGTRSRKPGVGRPRTRSFRPTSPSGAQSGCGLGCRCGDGAGATGGPGPLRGDRKGLYEGKKALSKALVGELMREDWSPVGAKRSSHRIRALDELIVGVVQRAELQAPALPAWFHNVGDFILLQRRHVLQGGFLRIAPIENKKRGLVVVVVCEAPSYPGDRCRQGVSVSQPSAPKHGDGA